MPGGCQVLPPKAGGATSQPMLTVLFLLKGDGESYAHPGIGVSSEVEVIT